MSLKYGFLNLLILFVVLMVGIENYHTWTQPIELLPEQQETVKKTAAKAENLPAVGTNKEPASLRSFILISERNIFSPERKDFPILATAEKFNPVTRPQLILYGITMAGDFQAASLVNPGRPLRKGEREAMTVKIGERIGAYKLARVQPDRITLESNGDSFEVLLYDSRNPKKRIEVKTEVKPPAVATTQPAPAPLGPPVAAPASAPPSASVEKVPPPVSVEKPKEPPQQQVVPPTPAPTPQRIPSRWERSQLRRGVMPANPPPSPPASLPTGTPEQGK
jgi:type II secretory pathway component PulC